MAWLLSCRWWLTAALTVAYSLRAWLRVFFGEGPADEAVHEAPPSMRVPLLLLAVPTVLGGLVVTVPGAWDRDAAPGPRAVELFHWSTSVLMTLWSSAPARSCSCGYQRHGRDLWPHVVVPHTPVDRV